MLEDELRDLLNKKYEQYHHPRIIEDDPISIPHQFGQKEDIEISAFLAATLAWGQRKSIIRSSQRLMQKMDYAPHDFILNHQPNDLKVFEGFVHRTFNFDDLQHFLKALQHIYHQHNGLENCFATQANETTIKPALGRFREIFFEVPHLPRTHKHVSNPYKNSACKRIAMYLRWMVRSAKGGVDFGIWKSISPSILSCPLDIHTGNVARHFGMLKRKQSDWKAVEELDLALRKLDPKDPSKYDFALFGMGVYEGIK